MRADELSVLIIGTFFLYQLLGYAGIVGIATTFLFLPVNRYTSRALGTVQDRLMAARDRRTSLMSEVLSSIRYIKFMAYERAFEQRILRAREEEIRQQRNNYLLHVAFNFVWGASPVACVLVSFLVFTKGMHRDLTPSVAFTSLAIFNELRYATNVLPYMFITTSQGIVSLKRIGAYSLVYGRPFTELTMQAEKHLGLADVENIGTDAQLVALQGHVEFPDPAPPVAFVNATITWSTAEVKGGGSSGCASGTRTPGLGNVNSARKNMGGRKFAVTDLMVDFPVGELSLVCGPLGSGKTLLLLGE